MPIRHLFLALLVVLIWGINFLFVKLALDEIAPLLLCALRFLLASVPAVFFIKPPNLPFRIIALYGLVMFGLQFIFVFVGMHLGMTAGMASLIMQTQVFFSMLFAAILLEERTTRWQLLGAFVAFLGIGLIALHFDRSISLVGFLCLLGAAATWGAGNLITKKNKSDSMIALVIWGSFFAFIPMMGLSFYFDGYQTIIDSLVHLSWQSLIAIVYIVYLSTWVGYGIWNWLLSRHPVGTVVPFTLLVPIVGVLSSVVWLGEPFQSWKVLACFLVLCGLLINLLGPLLRQGRSQVAG
ncbi:MAG: EamA family transporter [Tatlockia sp.]|jgi:O-acetylserine/cysteine efflux transporter